MYIIHILHYIHNTVRLAILTLHFGHYYSALQCAE
jgi:hypothetical protein